MNMNRRTFFSSAIVITIGTLAVYYGNKFYQGFKTPEINSLDEYLPLIDELSDAIIPRTDTPGAKDANVAIFIIDFVKNNANKKEQNKFIDGLVELEEKCFYDYKSGFLSLTDFQKREILTYFYNKGKNYQGNLGKINNKLFGRSFFELLKEYTCIGYCTSFEGATKGLAYELVPGKYIAKTNYLENQKSWATK